MDTQEPKNLSEQTSMPRIGDKAPEFTAVTTQGEINFPKQYKGNWVILFSHPADFTPVCTSEFMTFASLEKKFSDANCKLVGLSVDGLYSHIAWLRTIKEKIEYKGMKNVDVKFPLIEDITMEVDKGILGIVGRTGSGKTTLCHLLARLYPVEDGTVFWNDFDVNNLDLTWVRQRIALVPQDITVFSNSVLANI